MNFKQLINSILLVICVGLILLISISLTYAQVTEIPQDEYDALVALYNSTDGDNWTNNSGWLTNNTPSSWFGVTCAGWHVTILFLVNNQLIGSIPSELSNLVNLLHLHLNRNQLSGNIPPPFPKQCQPWNKKFNFQN